MTDTYIKMVVAAGKPLQDLIPERERDYFRHGYCIKHEDKGEYDEGYWIFIPSQKQLWNMLKDKVVEIHKTKEGICKAFLQHPPNTVKVLAVSKCLEIVLLQCVMYNCFNKKVWDAPCTSWGKGYSEAYD